MSKVVQASWLYDHRYIIAFLATIKQFYKYIRLKMGFWDNDVGVFVCPLEGRQFGDGVKPGSLRAGTQLQASALCSMLCRAVGFPRGIMKQIKAKS
jgi:hypothetical protein